jgi:hypothetical protein
MDRPAASVTPAAIFAEAHAIMGRHSSYQAAIDHVRTSARSLAPETRTDLLSRLILSCEAAHQVGWFELGAVIALLDDWHAHPEVRAWFNANLQKILETAIIHPALFDPEKDHLPSLQALATRYRADFFTALGEALAGRMTKLGPEKLFTLALLFWREAPLEHRGNLIDHALDESEARLRAVQRTPEPLADDPNASKELRAALCDFLFFHFGHPELRVRWRALHAARRLVQADAAYLNIFIERLGRKDRAGFGAKEEPFYWMSAKVSLHLFFLKLAHEHPVRLGTYASEFAQAALDPAFSHALVRELALRTCETLIRHCPDCLDAETRQKLLLVNQPRACAWPKTDGSTQPAYDEDAERHADHTTFSFDGMDTLPYWYEPLARIFGWATNTVCAQARRWICDRWHWRQNDVVAQSQRWGNRYEWHDKSNDHGNTPKVENLHTYLEFHAMHCVAGEWLERQPLVVDKWESGGHGWTRWMHRWVAAGSPLWADDLRQPTPLAPFLWSVPEDPQTWIKHRPNDDYDEPLGLVAGHPLPAELAVAASIEFESQQQSGSIHIVSTLVPTATARALLHALESNPDPLAHGIPCTMDEDAAEESDEPGFTMQAWLRRVGLDCPWQEFDPRLHGSSTAHYVLPDEFAQFNELERHGQTWKDLRGQTHARSELWSDYASDRSEQSDFRSHGDRLWLNRDLLLAHLCRVGMDLLLKVRLYRSISSRYHTRSEDGEKENPFSARHYLLRQDGTVEVMGKRRYAG